MVECLKLMVRNILYMVVYPIPHVDPWSAN